MLIALSSFEDLSSNTATHTVYPTLNHRNKHGIKSRECKRINPVPNQNHSRSSQLPLNPHYHKSLPKSFGVHNHGITPLRKLRRRKW